MEAEMTAPLYDFLESFAGPVAGESGAQVVACLLLALILPPLATITHEAGHALAARWFGVPVRAFVAAPEGPAVTIRRKGLLVRVGLGLGRDLRSQEPHGWVNFEQLAIPPRQAIAVIRAGPIAEAILGVVVLGAAAVPQPWLSRVVFAIDGVAMLGSAWVNLHDRSRPNSDGAQIQRILDAGLNGAPITLSASTDESHTSSSVAPPGY